MQIYNSFITLFLFLFCLSSCTLGLFNRTRSLNELKNLGETNLIKIEVSEQDEQGVWLQYSVRTIDDPKQIDLITETFQNYSDDWQGGYVPYLPGRLTIDFYKDEKLIIPIMVVYYTNTSGGLSYFLSRPAGPARPIEETEFKELMKLLGIDEDLAYYGDLEISTNSP